MLSNSAMNYFTHMMVTLAPCFQMNSTTTDSTGVTEVARVKDDGSGKLILFKIQNGVEVTIDETLDSYQSERYI